MSNRKAIAMTISPRRQGFRSNIFYPSVFEQNHPETDYKNYGKNSKILWH
jgi:hypothetical protein